MPKATSSADQRQSMRHNPLAEDYSPTTALKQKAPKRRRGKSEADEEKYVDSRASRKILQIGQELADEEEAERATSRTITAPNPAFDFNSRFAGEEEDGENTQYDDDDDAWGDEEEEEIVIDEEIDPNDLAVYNKFINPQFDDPILHAGEPSTQDEGQGTKLADLILEKIAAFEASQRPTADGAVRPPEVPEDAVELDARVVEAFTKIGQLLSRYKSGKLPKLFKILPTLPDWQTFLSITRPDSWTPHAVLAATKIFVSTKPHIVQEFLSEVLLPAVRSDIYETHKLNTHLYQALKKALYKPSAFFKGILFPLLSSAATQREATIIASAIVRVSVPVLHSAAALYRLCDIAAEQMSVDTESAGATNICIRALLEKKYALPFKVVDALVFHFLRFKALDLAAGDEGMSGVQGGTVGKESKLPVVWHQCLLAFAQRYRNDITEDQREALLDLLLVRPHPTISPEVRRELLEGRGRGVMIEPSVGNGGDDTMMAIDP